jgi:hypothetical protein
VNEALFEVKRSILVSRLRIFNSSQQTSILNELFSRLRTQQSSFPIIQNEAADPTLTRGVSSTGVSSVSVGVSLLSPAKRHAAEATSVQGATTILVDNVENTDR